MAESGFSTSWAFQKPYEYYSSFEKQPHLCDKFRDIDDEASFLTYLHLLEDAHTRNFVLDFGNEDAWCAVNLEREDIASLLRSPVSIDRSRQKKRLLRNVC